MTLIENIRIAKESIRANALRAVITCLIISIGITALVGILTAIDAIKSTITQNFSGMGANSFNIKNRVSTVQFGGKRGGKKTAQYFEPLSFREAREFKQQYTFNGAFTSVSAKATFGATAKYQSQKTDANINVLGIDEKYLEISGYKIEKGRNFSSSDVELSNNNALVGKDIIFRLFKNENPLGKEISLGGARYKIVGVLASKGNSVGSGGDRVIYLPITTVKQKYLTTNSSYVITCAITNPEMIEEAVAEAIPVMRNIRKVSPAENDNFEISKSDSLAEEMISNLRYITVAATIIGLITLFGAAVGLMNIMLVSVTERTREIGTRKAMGATPAAIRDQFLIEALMICQIGGLGGIVFGIIIGNIVSAIIGGGFIIPWLWILVGIILCLITGVTAGYIPARKASRLDPVEALRFE